MALQNLEPINDQLADIIVRAEEPWIETEPGKAWMKVLWTGPETGRWAEKHKAEKQAVLKMEFKRFLHGFMLVPCQIIRQARRIVYRLLAWNPWQQVFLRGVEALRCPLRC